MKPIIQVEGLSKSFVISHQQRAAYGSLRDELVGFLRRSAQPHLTRGSREKIWALEDVSFEVNQGDIVGIVGKNGSGKSTLLKVLSRIIEPTRGRATLRGSVTSLLEVGTGFHLELTGRENVYLNGAILGMPRREIDQKFDEIIAFSGVEKFLDTPVKFYSSGMYVRLAFAVAAHLESDILIVDEVLAVGDTEFRKKSLGRMQTISRAGRTVLFVSHNMGSVRQLCTRGVLMSAGHARVFEDVSEMLLSYADESLVTKGQERAVELKGMGIVLEHFRVNGQAPGAQPHLPSGESIEITLRYKSKKPHDLQLGFGLKDKQTGSFPVFTHSGLEGEKHLTKQTGEVRARLAVPRLAPSTYSLEFHAWVDGELIETELEVAELVILPAPAFSTGQVFATFPSAVLVDSEWDFEGR